MVFITGAIFPDRRIEMITLSRIRELDIAEPPADGRPLHVSAASGLACVKSFQYVVADDELHLGVFRAGDDAPGHLIRLFDGVLPDQNPKRKKQKPDFEALTVLPSFGTYSHGALLALGSGSKRNRRGAALLRLDADGAVDSAPFVLDLAPVFAPLDDLVRGLNIEGAVVSGNELRLFQRGNEKNAGNAIIRMKVSGFMDVLTHGPDATVPPFAVDFLDLGDIGGVALSLTDAAALPNGDMVFTAIAEDSDNAYDDGACIGAAIGILGDDGTVRMLHHLDQPHKIEGVAARMEGDTLHLLLVTDADDADIPATLYSAIMEVPRR